MCFWIHCCAFLFVVVLFILQLWATVVTVAFFPKNKPQTPPMSWLIYITTHTHCLLSLQVTTCSGRLCQALKSVVVATKDAAQNYPSVQATQEMVDRVAELSQHAAGFSGLLQRLAEISWCLLSFFFFMTAFFHDNALFVVHYYYILFRLYAEEYHDCVWFITLALSDLMVKCWTVPRDGLCAIVCVCKWECTGLWLVYLFSVPSTHHCVLITYWWVFVLVWGCVLHAL